MSGLGSDLAIVVRRTVRIVVRRWLLVAILAASLVVANLVQAAISAPNLARLPALAAAMTMLFLVGRLAVLVMLHIVGIRLAGDPDLPARRVFALDAGQALWFHGLILIWIVGLSFRYGVGGPVMRLMTLHGTQPLLADILVTAAYLLLLFVLFVRLQPGFVGVMLGDPEASARWSLRVVNGQVWRLFTIATVVGMPLLLLRQTLAHAFVEMALPVALVDGIVSTLMMLLPSVTYHRVYERIKGRV